MPLEFHSDARRRFEQLGMELKGMFRSISRKDLSHATDSFRPDVLSSLTINESDVVDIPYIEKVNQLSMVTQQVLFDDGTHAFELGEEGCQHLAKLVEAIQRSGQVKQMVSMATLRANILKWLNPSKNDNRTLPQQLSQEISPLIQAGTAWVPIASLCLQSPLSFAGYTMQPITAAQFDTWETGTSQGDPAKLERLRHHFKSEREKYQGLSAITLEFEAEPQRAYELAIEVADRVVTLIRTFCIENLHPNACSFVVPFGNLALISDHAWLLDHNGHISKQRSLLKPPFPTSWVIADEHMTQLQEMGLEELSTVAATPNPNDFQEKLLSALLIYNRANISREPIDKLVYILVSLETMLLRNQSEPIQASLSDRLALMVGSDINECIEIVSLIKGCYHIRSKYIHHGQSLKEIATLEKFFKYCWVFFTRLIRSQKHFTTKDSFLDYLDRKKFECVGARTDINRCRVSP